MRLFLFYDGRNTPYSGTVFSQKATVVVYANGQLMQPGFIEMTPCQVERVNSGLPLADKARAALRWLRWGGMRLRALLVATALTLLWPTISAAQLSNNDPFAALVSERAASVQGALEASSNVQRYVITTDERVFLFENLGEAARLQYLCRDQDERLDCALGEDKAAAEIHDVQATTGPRGDVLYKNELGNTLLRIASYGGATVYWPGNSMGHAASKSFGDDQALTLVPATIAQAQAKAQRATAHISALIGAPIIIEIFNQQKNGASDGTVLADAIARVARAVQLVGQDKLGADALRQQIIAVKLIEADVAEISRDGGVLEIRYAPAQGLSGRPASSSIVRFLEESL